MGVEVSVGPGVVELSLGDGEEGEEGELLFWLFWKLKNVMLKTDYGGKS